MSAGRLLEQATVTSIHGKHKFGTSIASVREVAATGKLCVMALDHQGVRSLQVGGRHPCPDTTHAFSCRPDAGPRACLT